jgi:hypothetical protein
MLFLSIWCSSPWCILEMISYFFPSTYTMIYMHTDLFKPLRVPTIDSYVWFISMISGTMSNTMLCIYIWNFVFVFFTTNGEGINRRIMYATICTSVCFEMDLKMRTFMIIHIAHKEVSVSLLLVCGWWRHFASTSFDFRFCPCKTKHILRFGASAERGCPRPLPWAPDPFFHHLSVSPHAKKCEVRRSDSGRST